MSWSSSIRKQREQVLGAQRPNLVTLKQLMGGGVNPAAAKSPYGKWPGSRILNTVADRVKPGGG